jgi:hypothetical protein
MEKSQIRDLGWEKVGSRKDYFINFFFSWTLAGRWCGPWLRLTWRGGGRATGSNSFVFYTECQSPDPWFGPESRPRKVSPGHFFRSKKKIINVFNELLNQILSLFSQFRL